MPIIDSPSRVKGLNSTSTSALPNINIRVGDGELDYIDFEDDDYDSEYLPALIDSKLFTAN
jgi:hypothetical protein